VSDSVGDFTAAVTDGFARATGMTPRLHVTGAAAGTELTRLEWIRT
jgi:hypothetical protein